MLKRVLFFLAIFAYTQQCIFANGSFPYKLADETIAKAIIDSIIPGAVLCVVEDGAISYLQAYGNRSVFPEQSPMTTNTIFDLASLSKPLGAGTAMLLLCAEGKANIDDFVAQYISNYHKDVRIRHLMTHYSGLPAYMNVARLDSICNTRKMQYSDRPNFMIDTIATCKRPSAVGEKYRYSCLNFISLQRVVENIVNTDINTYLRNTHYQSLNFPIMVGCQMIHYVIA
jgi:CubicO group peptidase (beta-lactamase class C family)